jgi:phosphoglycerate dehydrogenase-like enzyme
MPVQVASLDDHEGVTVASRPWERLGNRVEVVAFPHLEGSEELVAALGSFEIVVAMRERTPLPRAVIERLPALRMVATTGPFNGVLDLAALEDHGVVVSGSCYSASSTAEQAVALLLAVTRRIPAQDRSMKEGRWEHLVGPELWGRTLGVVGLGRIGAMVARVGLAFGMRVIAWSENLEAERCAEVGVEPVGREELFAAADFVTVHVRGSERAVGYVGADDLARMKPTAYLVNTSRGTVVDEEALVEALVAGRIAGAGLDVYATEPLPIGHPLRGLANVVLTPHSGYVASGLYERWGEELVDAIGAYLDGRPVNLITAQAPLLDLPGFGG